MNPIDLARTFAMGAILSAASVSAYSQTKSIPDAKQDTFEYRIPDTGTSEPDVLKDAPSPSIKIAGESKNAVMVVDLSTNVLYKYDSNGLPILACRVAIGKPSTPTNKGVRVVSHVEKSPYSSAIGSKRKRHPAVYGKYVIILKNIDPKSGAQSKSQQFIHGTNAPETPRRGLYASKGCIRSNIISQLKDSVKRGDIVIIK